MATEQPPSGNGDDGIEVESGGVLATLSAAEIDVQIKTAKAYPRSIKEFRRQAMELATLDEETARSMFYVIPRDGRKIEGPSIRMAEVAASAWKNLRIGGRIIDIGAEFVTAQGMAFDLESNLASTIETRRRILDKYGRRYSTDMIGTTANAAMAIAVRNAIFKVIPFALLKGVFEEAKKVSTGKNLTMEQKRTKAIEAFTRDIKAAPADVFRVVKRKGIEDVSLDDLITLNGIYTAIKDGEPTWAAILDELPKSDAQVLRDLETPIDATATHIPEGRAAQAAAAKDRLLNDEEIQHLDDQRVTLGISARQLKLLLQEHAGVTTLDELPLSKAAGFAALVAKQAA